MDRIATDWQTRERIEIGSIPVLLCQAKLMQLVFESGDREGWHNPAPGFTEVPAAALRSVILYCLVLNVYSAEEMVESSEENPAVRYLCANGSLDWQTIHEYRKRNATLIQVSLAHLLRAIGAHLALSDDVYWREAQARLRRAIQADSIVLDL